MKQCQSSLSHDGLDVSEGKRNFKGQWQLKHLARVVRDVGDRRVCQTGTQEPLSRDQPLHVYSKGPPNSGTLSV
jgi:hypothetical protein